MTVIGVKFNTNYFNIYLLFQIYSILYLLKLNTMPILIIF